MNNATKLPSDDTAPTTLTPLYPDTQNETARNLTKSERLAVMQRIQELVLQLNTRVRYAYEPSMDRILTSTSTLTPFLSTFSLYFPSSTDFPKQQRFDPSTVASEKTCMDVSKLLPASLDHEDERDEALETLRNLMSTSFDMLNECFNKGGSRDDLKRPNWAPAKGRQEQSVAMAKLLSHCLWALFVSPIQPEITSISEVSYLHRHSWIQSEKCRGTRQARNTYRASGLHSLSKVVVG